MGQAANGMVEVLKHYEGKMATQAQKIDIDPARGVVAYFDPQTRAIVPRDSILANAVATPVKPRAYDAQTMESLAAMVTSMAGKVPEGQKPKAIALVSLAGVQVYLDERERRDRVTFKMCTSRTWEIIRRLEAAAIHRSKGDHGADGGYGVFTQEELIELLQVDIDATLDPADLIEIVSNLKSTGSSKAASTLDTGKFTLSKEVSAEVTGSKDLPKEITLGCRVLRNVKLGDAEIEQKVVCKLHCDPGSLKFTLAPRGGRVDAAEADTLDKLVAHLREKLAGVAEVYAASPNA